MTTESFHFLRPLWLLGLLVLPLVPVLARRRHRTAGAWEQVCDPSLLPHLLSGGRVGARGYWPTGLCMLGLAAACVAAAGPAWQRLPETTYSEPTQTVVALQLSPSMNARDVAPSRVARARYELQDLVATASGALGLVVFAEEGYPITPLTDDPAVIEQMIPTLDPNLMPGRRTRLDRGIEVAHGLLSNVGASAGRIVVVADGPGDDPEAALAAARASLADGYPVSVLVVGGDVAAMTPLAEAGGGRISGLRADDGDIESVLASGGALPGDRSALRDSGVRADVWRDMGPWLLFIPLLFAPFAFRRGWVGAVVAMLFFTVTGTEARADLTDWFSRSDQQAARAFAEGRNAEAAAHFERPDWQGAAHYRAGDYAAAIESLSPLEASEDRYNLGNALAKSGRLEESLQVYGEVLAQAPNHADARHNRDLVAKLLEQKQQQEQKQEGQEASQGQGEDAGDPQQGAGSEPDAGEASGASSREPGESGGEEGEGTNAGDSEPRPGEQGAEGQSDRKPGEASDAAGHDDAEDERQAAGQQHAHVEAPEQHGTGSAGHDRTEPVSEAPAVDQTGDTESQGEPGRETSADRRGGLSEQDQKVEQMLERVPDDPGGLLREKLRRRYWEKQRLGMAGSAASRGGWK